MNVYKVTPVSLYDIQGLEQWLEKQAAVGRFPLRVTGDYTRFERRDAVSSARFRLEPSNGQEFVEPERLELYSQAGWSYFGTVAQMYFLFYTFDPAAPELHTDLVTQGLSLEWLAQRTKRARRNTRIWRAAVLGLFLAGIFLGWTTDPRRLPLLLRDLSGSALLFLVFFFWMWRREEEEVRLLLDLQSSLELGISPAPKPAIHWHQWMVPLALLTLILLIGDKLYQSPTSLEGFSRPYVDLAVLESEPMAEYQELFPEERPQSWNRNTVSRWFSLLAPNHYTVEQHLYSFQAGTSPGSLSPEDDEHFRYSPSLTAVYFHLTIPPLARTMAMAQLAQMELVNLPWSYEEVDWPGLDLAVLARNQRDGIWQMAAVVKGSRVAVFRYAGRENLADHLDVLASVV